MKTNEAVLLSSPDLSIDGKRVGKLLSFFGVPWRTLTIEELLAKVPAGHSTSANSRVFCSAEVFLRLMENLERNPDCIQAWRERISSAFIFAGDNAEVVQKLARRLTGDRRAVLSEITPGAVDFAVSDDLDAFCGVMAGVRVTVSKADVDASLVLRAFNADAINIISLDRGATFLKLAYQEIPVFLSTSKSIIDTDAILPTGIFDIREYVTSALPIVLYIKWAFAEICWSSTEANACLIIDDPVLKPTHGFVKFDELLSLMKRHRFSTNIAFIPWNWRRSSPEVVQLFKDNPDNYSISVHGCDHTQAEFGCSDRERLSWRVKQALERMNHHESNTGIPHDRVMVFPQGVFSEGAMSALKHSDLIAAVNNDTISVDPHPRAMRISELWDIAVMCYDNFPIFTRRNPWEGVENFAFDVLLGKPAVIVIHHDFCRDHYKHLLEFINRLNALKCQLSWRSLGEVVRRSCRQKELPPGLVDVEMYGTELRLENRSAQRNRYLLRRRESEPSEIREIRSGSQSLGYKFTHGYVRFEVHLNAGESTVIRIKFRGLDTNGASEESLSYRTNVMLRRYFCEVRDNYIVTSKHHLLNLFNGSGSDRPPGCRPYGPEADL